jgi:hypothetical protein
MYRVMEETEERRELKGKMALLKEMMAKKAKKVARQAAKKEKRKNTDQTGLRYFVIFVVILWMGYSE